MVVFDSIYPYPSSRGVGNSREVGAQISSPPYLISIVSSLLFGKMLGHGGLTFTTQSENTEKSVFPTNIHLHLFHVKILPLQFLSTG